MKIYRLVGAGSGFKRAQLTCDWLPSNSGVPPSADYYRNVSAYFLYGSPRLANWKPWEVEIYPPAVGIPFDIRLFPFGGMIATQNAVEKLRPVFDHGGVELLPQPINGESYFIINVIKKVSSIVREEPPKGKLHVPDIARFRTDVITTPIYKDTDNPLPIFCAEELGDPARELRAATAHHNLRGLGFRLIWEG